MLVILSSKYSLHNPKWKFTLGTESYETRDTPLRVEVIRQALEKDSKYRIIRSKSFPDSRLKDMHPYHDFIKKTSASIKDEQTEVYPDLFPGEGANLPRKNLPLWGGIYCTDAVTPIMKRTYASAKGSAEAALTGAQHLIEKKVSEVYALCRPSGHHAGPRVFGGYCYFNNTSLAAQMLSEHGRVAVLDIDYHHGNGTQEFFWKRDDVFTCSIHGDPEYEYPYFWGYKDEIGEGKGKNCNLNLPLPAKADDERYMKAVKSVIAAIKRFKPDYLVIAAGFDTHADDPIGGLNLSNEVYPRIGEALGKMGLPTLICQEGGYNTKVLECAVTGLLGGFKSARL